MTDDNLKEQIAEIKADIREIRQLVTNLRIDQKGLQVKSSLWGLMGGAIAIVPVILMRLLSK